MYSMRDKFILVCLSIILKYFKKPKTGFEKNNLFDQNPVKFQC